MKRLFSFVVLTLLMFLLSGCIPISLRPWYADEDVIVEPNLSGVYVDKAVNETQTTTITRDGAKGYKMRIVTHSDKGEEEIRLRLRLFRIDQDEFLDYAPDFSGQERAMPPVFPSIDGHVVAKVVQIRPRLQVVGLNYDWLKNYLTDYPYALHHEDIEDDDKNGSDEVSHDDLVLTASTAALRRFLHDHANDPKAFPEPDSDEGMELKMPLDESQKEQGTVPR